MFLRKSSGSRLNVFAPVNDLSALSKTGSSDRAGGLVAGPRNDVAVAGGQILGDEWSDHVVKVRRKTGAAGTDFETTLEYRIDPASFFERGEYSLALPNIDTQALDPIAPS